MRFPNKNIMMKKFSFVALLLQLSIMKLLAAPVDSTAALQMATNFYKSNNVVANANGMQIRFAKTEKTFQRAIPSVHFNNLYIFNASDGNGFVIMSADDRSYPVLGYSDKGSFRTDSIAPQVVDWLRGYDREIDYLIANDIPATDEIAAEWQNLRTGGQIQTRNTRSVSPLIQTTWNQSPYYNLLCPYDEDAEDYTVTGCAATAMAQVLKYWEYPNVGTGTHTYYDQNYGWQSADFEVPIYWNEMPNSLSSSSSTMQVYSVARLMRLCGVSANMQYGTASVGGSSATYENVERALVENFNYSQNLELLYKDNFLNAEEWLARLKNDLDNGRPILYAGSDLEHGGGHAFVCDGYNNNSFHFNWGWGGNYNGYYQLSALSPGAGQIGGGSGSYSDYQRAILGCVPAETISHPNYDLVMNSTLTTNSSSYIWGDDITITRSVKNSGAANFSGYIIVMVTDNYGNPVAHTCNYATITSNHTNTASVHFSGDMPFVPGNYIVNVFSAIDTNDLNTFRLVRDNATYQNLAQFTITYSASIETNSDFYFSTGDVLYANRAATINVDVLNAGSSTFTGSVAVGLSDLDGNFEQFIDQGSLSNGLQANYHYTNGLEFTGNITVPAGEHFIMLLYQNPNETSWYYAGSSEYGNPVRIRVASPPTPDIYEQNNTVSAAYALPTNFINDTCVIYTTGSNIHISTDMDYYKVVLPAGYSYEFGTFLLDWDYDDYHYPADCMFSMSANGTNNWSANCDGGEGPEASLSNGGSVYFKVFPYTDSEILGDYLLGIAIIRHILPDQYESNNTAETAYQLSTVTTNNATINVNANFHETTDRDFYRISLPSGFDYVVNATIYTEYNSNLYTADAKFATSTDASSWSSNYGTQMPELMVSNGGTLYLRVLPYTSDEIGTYQLHITISRCLQPDQYEPNNSAITAYMLSTINSNNVSINVNANFHLSSDMDFYKLNLPAGYDYTVNISLCSSTNSSTYTAAAKFSVSTSPNSWPNTYNSQMPAMSVNNGGELYLRVLPLSANEMGTYQVRILIHRTPAVGIENQEERDWIVYPNPTSDALHILAPQAVAVNRMEILSFEGKVVKCIEGYCTEIDVSDLAAGTYILRIRIGNEVLTKKWCKYN